MPGLLMSASGTPDGAEFDRTERVTTIGSAVPQGIPLGAQSEATAFPPESGHKRDLRAYYAELIVLRVGEHVPRLLAGLADVGLSGPEGEQPRNLGAAIFRAGSEIEMEPVLDRLRRRPSRHKAQSDGCIDAWPDDDFAVPC